MIRRLDLNVAVARAHAAVFAVDGRGRITLWNRAAETLLGHPARDVLGRPSCEIFRPERHGAATLCYRGCHAGLVPLDAPTPSVEIRMRTRTGRRIRLDVGVLVIAGAHARRATILHALREAAAPPAAGRRRRDAVGVASDAVLTRREIDVLRLMGAGLSTRALARALNVSAATVRNHAQSILRKLEVHSRLAAVAAAHRRALLS